MIQHKETILGLLKIVTMEILVNFEGVFKFGKAVEMRKI